MTFLIDNTNFTKQQIKAWYKGFMVSPAVFSERTGHFFLEGMVGAELVVRSARKKYVYGARKNCSSNQTASGYGG